MERATLDFWVGLFVVAGLAALLALALKVGNMSSFGTSHSYSVQADFSNIGGLKIRAPVKSAGVVVGRVSDIRFDNQTFEATVTMKLDNKYNFPKDTSAAIMTSGLLGEQYLALEPGGDMKNLVAGDKIKITQSAVVLESLISQFLYNKASDAPTADSAQVAAPNSGVHP
ncbi:outer membrane lipid asymmetry maintenance protein MlaD [Sulfuriferula thiophila]|uniref:outer membrane lipid asymmetry maintenance protein MlaD n=1 Tax=Sulfuriferula thiophila TaxID=1781211 RepID=UPI000F613F0C|nr:outer membrane lipid asymmetry maintenance protein MlaD [Sulfuriferula thiophila]